MIDKNEIKEAKIKEPVKNEFYELLKSKFPQTINSDGAVNFDAIKMLLDIKVKENIKGYELNWTGKGLANALYNTPCDKELKFNETKSKNSDTTQNIIIKGDNLDALKILKSAYYEKIKMIYIDPPYNTKNDDFIYPDDFRKDYKQICIETGLIKIEIDEFGNETEVLSEAMNFFTSITSTKSHSGWLSFMLPRLKLARDLLRDDGVIFISIDDNEQANLKLLCDEIFGEENFVVSAIHENVKIRKNSAKTFSMSHDSVLIYAKNIDCWERVLLPRTDLSNYKNPDDDPRGVWIAIPIHANHFYNADYKITKPNGVVLEKPKNQSWRLSEENFKKHVKENRIWWGSGNSYPMIKKFLNEVQNGLVPRSIFYYDETGGNPAGDKSVKELFNGTKVFDNPKPVELVKLMIKISTNPNNSGSIHSLDKADEQEQGSLLSANDRSSKQNLTQSSRMETTPDIILDFFAGSGTTAHAVMEQNAIDGGNRKFILVQLDEKIDEKKSKTAFDFCKNELGSKEPVISDITIERVKRAGNKLEKPNLDTGFCVYDLTDKDTLIQKSDGTLGLYLNRDLTPLDKALNLALQSGKTVDIKSEEICKDKLYKFDDSYYVVSYDKNVLESLEATTDKPVYISGYNDIKLDDFLNLQSVLKDRLNVVY